MYHHHRGILTRTLPSKINANGVRVYIPLKGKRDGRPWLKPVVVNTFEPAVQYPLLLSFDASVTIPVRFWHAQYIMTTPFSRAQIEEYARKAAAQGHLVATVRDTPLSIYDLSFAPSARRELYTAYLRPADKPFNARLAFALGLSIVKSERLPALRYPVLKTPGLEQAHPGVERTK